MADNFHTFQVFILSDLAYARSKRCCPHCKSTETPQQIDYFGTVYQPAQGDILQCVECRELTIVADVPYIESDTPVLTKWSVPGIETPQKGGLTQ